MVATSIVFFPAAPLFLFIKGKDITIPKGTEITAYVNDEYALDAAKFTATTPTAAAPSATPAAAPASIATTATPAVSPVPPATSSDEPPASSTSPATSAAPAKPPPQ
jgi:hypothetical protein